MDPAIWAACIVFFGFDLAVILLPLGAFLLTRPEGYEPADRLDRRRRIALRATAMIPIGAIILAAYNMHSNPYFAYFYVYGIGVIPDPGWQSADFLAIGMVPPALLLFFHLRAIAKRARSAHLAEHCAIVARGTAATLLFLAAVIVLIEQGDDWFGNNWIYRSRTIMVVLLILSVFGCLFILWSLYLLVRFAISFRRAAQQAKQQWRRDDRALEPP
jgi:hypothetical protein